MRTTDGDQHFFKLIHAIMLLDPEDKLTMGDHAFKAFHHCITNEETRRAVTVCRFSTTCEIDYIDGNGDHQEMQVYDEPAVAVRVIAFLNRETVDV